MSTELGQHDPDSTRAAIRATVRDAYAAATRATTGQTTSCGPGNTTSCCTPDGATQEVFGPDLYQQADRDQLPSEAVAASLGCGNPLAVADLHPGETVLDLGSGGGIDVLLSARRVGPTGTAYGLDMTDEMLDLARRNAEQAGATNVEFLRGHIEDIPCPTPASTW